MPSESVPPPVRFPVRLTVVAPSANVPADRVRFPCIVGPCPRFKVHGPPPVKVILPNVWPSPLTVDVAPRVMPSVEVDDQVAVGTVPPF